MSVSPISAIEKSFSYFRSTNYRSRRAINDFIGDLEQFSNPAIFGGMCRDLYLLGNRDFYSDVDIVLNDVDEDYLNRRMISLGAAQNRYGGYRVLLNKWMVDIWPLKRTWAHKEGIVKLDSISDIVSTTFFNWDAAVLYTKTNRLYARLDYSNNLSCRILDINLRQNPNPIGNAIRALRLALRYDAKLTYPLIEYLHEHLSPLSEDGVREAELKSHKNSYLSYIDYSALKALIKSSYDRGLSTDVFSISPNRNQEKLSFSESI